MGLYRGAKRISTFSRLKSRPPAMSEFDYSFNGSIN